MGTWDLCLQIIFVCLTHILLGVIPSWKKNKWHFEFISEWAFCPLYNAFHLPLHYFKFRELNNDIDSIYDSVQLYFTFPFLNHIAYLKHFKKYYFKKKTEIIQWLR